MLLQKLKSYLKFKYIHIESFNQNLFYSKEIDIDNTSADFIARIILPLTGKHHSPKNFAFQPP